MFGYNVAVPRCVPAEIEDRRRFLSLFFGSLVVSFVLAAAQSVAHRPTSCHFLLASFSLRRGLARNNHEGYLFFLSIFRANRLDQM